MRSRSSLRALLSRLDMSAPARAERRSEAAIRRERDNVDSADRRAAALEAERRRYSYKSGWTPQNKPGPGP